MSKTSKTEFLRNIKIFVNYVSKYYNGTPSVRNRLISYTQLDMTCPRRVERDIPHLQWHNFLESNKCALRNINDTVTMWCLAIFITWQWLWIKTWIKCTFPYYVGTCCSIMKIWYLKKDMHEHWTYRNILSMLWQ